MAFVRVEQRNGHLAAAVRIESVKGKDGPLTKGTVTVISNVRRGSGDERDDEATAIQWTLWGRLAENAAQYLGTGSHVNVVGRLRNDNYENGEGKTVYGMVFVCEEIDYLESRATAEARRAGGSAPALSTVAMRTKAPAPRRAGAAVKAGPAKALDPNDIPF